MENKVTSKEIMINRNGKPLFAVKIGDSEREASYIFVESGEVKFSSSWLNSIIPYELSNESHRLAKEIFTIGLQAAVKTKIYELKQLESILKDLNLVECLGNVMVDNTKLLLEVKNQMETNMREIVGEVKPAVEQAITDTVRPIAIKKNRKPLRTGEE